MGKKQAWNGDFRAHGLVEKPRSVAEFRGVIAARTCIEKLGCFEQAREMMALNHSRREVADYIQQEAKECTTTALATMMQYVGLYRKFVIPPIDFVREPAPKPEIVVIDNSSSSGKPQDVGVMRNVVGDLVGKITRLSAGVQEAEGLLQLIQIQQARITGAVVVEQQLGGWLTAGLNPEIRLLTDMYVALRNMKSDLGCYQEHGYGRAARNVNVNLSQQTRVDWPNMEEREKVPLLAFATKLESLLMKPPPQPEEKTVMAGS